jgi:Ca2+-binding EF-hand superfamily protein
MHHCVQDGTGRISYRMLTQYTNKYGGASLSADELRSIFTDFKPGADNLITQDEFITFFSRVSRTISNSDFDALVNDMLA